LGFYFESLELLDLLFEIEDCLVGLDLYVEGFSL